LTTTAPIIVWLRRDLRLADNPAMVAACRSGRPVVPVFILDDTTPGPWRMGGASRWWLYQSLASLGARLQALGQRLILRRGVASVVLRDLLHEGGASAVYWNRTYEPAEIARDSAIKADLRADGLEVESFAGNLAFEPWAVKTGAGGPFKVYTPFRRACMKGAPPVAPLPAPQHLLAPDTWPASEALADWQLQPTMPDWAGGLRETWEPGEAAATERFEGFLAQGLADYASGRDYPARAAVSRLSPHLHFGEITPRQIWQRLSFLEGHSEAVEKFRAEILWREFSHHLLFHFPDLPEKNWKPAFDAFPWREDAAGLAAWQQGMTGYPFVDAGMRELWHTGYVHNRVRMIVASFLVKHLLLHWREGADWFWDTLVDADLASNAASWQWVAGSGADAAPYFRIFNPIKQGQDYDPEGGYTRRWVPELAGLPDKWLQEPWNAPAEVLAAAGVVPGKTYPHPIVDHKVARQRALDAYQQIRGS